jgi:hypothetical protein
MLDVDLRQKEFIMKSKGPSNTITIITLSIICFLAVSVQVSGQLPRLILNEVYVDFDKGVDNPLIKTKFNVYDPVGPTTEQFD